MNHPIRVTTLVEDTVNARGLLAEHGLAFYIESGPKRILLDAGQTQILFHNAQKLGISLETIDAVAVSHRHYDHTGALPEIMARIPHVKLYLHPDALMPKYARNPDGTSRSVGMSDEMVEQIRQRGGSVIRTVEVTEISERIFVTGPIPRATCFEDVGGAFLLGDTCTQPDLLWDDQALFFESRHGINVILGCAHAGVVNTLQYIQLVTGGKPIHTVLGGMHLLAASPERLDHTIVALRELGVQRLGPAHCTGCSATAALWTAFAGSCFCTSTGSQITFEID